MLIEELMKEEYDAGKAEGKTEALGNAKAVLVDLLSEIAPISDNLKGRVSSIKELEDVMHLTIKAAKADSLDMFEKELEKMGY